MSYILDALRKADAQRSRGTVPDLRAQPLGEPSAGDAPAPRRWLAWGIGLLALAVGGGVAWWALAPAAGPAAAPPARALPPTPAPGADPVVPAPADAAPPVAPPSPAAPIAEVRLLPPPRAAAPEAVRPASAAVPPAAVPSPGVATPAAATSPGTPPPAATASAPPPRVPKLAELAPELRAQVPALTVGGAMYSQDAANRMLIVNGQLYREGDQPAPGVVLERIQLKSAVLSVRGTRFEIAY